MKDINTQPRRRFLGKIDNFVDKAERAFEKKHLKAYLNGQTFFLYGKDSLGEPIRYEVKQEFIGSEIIK